MLNDPVYVECAKALAVRMRNEAPGDAATMLRHGVELATGRAAKDADVATLLALYDRLLAKYRADESAAKAYAGTPEDAALAGTAAVILNLDDVLNKS